MALDLRAAAELPCDPEAARAELAVLDGYPAWLGIVRSVDPAAPDPADAGPAWWVELGGRIGFVHKSKRVRMVRTLAAEDLVRFARCELDGRLHNAWVLEARFGAAGPGRTQLEMVVHYGGDRRMPLVDGVLRGEVGRAGRRLADRLAKAK